MITLSAALETTNLRRRRSSTAATEASIFSGGSFTITIRYAALSMADVLAKSSNIGAIQIGLKVGDATMYKYDRKFGFGQEDGDRPAGRIGGNAAAGGGLDAEFDRVGGDGA